MTAVKDLWGKLCDTYRKICRALGNKDNPYYLPYVIARNNGYIRDYFQKREQYHSAIEFIHETITDKTAYIGVEGDVMPVMYDYQQLYLDPRTDEMAQTLAYYVAKSNDGDIAEMTSRGFELLASDGYVDIYQNPHYAK